MIQEKRKNKDTEFLNSMYNKSYVSNVIEISDIMMIVVLYYKK